MRDFGEQKLNSEKNLLYETIRHRRSTRVFSKKVPDRRIIEQILEAAIWAPSAGNLQPWIFLVIRRDEMKRRLAKAALDQRFIAEAPLVIVVCADTMRSAGRYGERGVQLYCIQDTAAATQNILLAAHSLGLATCWVGAFNENDVRGVLELPPDVRPMALVPIGFSEGRPRAPPRRFPTEVVRWLD